MSMLSIVPDLPSEGEGGLGVLCSQGRPENTTSSACGGCAEGTGDRSVTEAVTAVTTAWPPSLQGPWVAHLCVGTCFSWLWSQHQAMKYFTVGHNLSPFGFFRASENKSIQVIFSGDKQGSPDESRARTVTHECSGGHGRGRQAPAPQVSRPVCGWALWGSSYQWERAPNRHGLSPQFLRQNICPKILPHLITCGLSDTSLLILHKREGWSVGASVRGRHRRACGDFVSNTLRAARMTPSAPPHRSLSANKDRGAWEKAALTDRNERWNF